VYVVKYIKTSEFKGYFLLKEFSALLSTKKWTHRLYYWRKQNSHKKVYINKIFFHWSRESLHGSRMSSMAPG
jgi:hypothetical protein